MFQILFALSSIGSVLIGEASVEDLGHASTDVDLVKKGTSSLSKESASYGKRDYKFDSANQIHFSVPEIYAEVMHPFSTSTVEPSHFQHVKMKEELIVEKISLDQEIQSLMVKMHDATIEKSRFQETSNHLRNKMIEKCKRLSEIIKELSAAKGSIVIKQKEAKLDTLSKYYISIKNATEQSEVFFLDKITSESGSNAALAELLKKILCNETYESLKVKLECPTINGEQKIKLIRLISHVESLMHQIKEGEIKIKKFESHNIEFSKKTSDLKTEVDFKTEELNSLKSSSAQNIKALEEKEAQLTSEIILERDCMSLVFQSAWEAVNKIDDLTKRQNDLLEKREIVFKNLSLFFDLDGSKVDDVCEGRSYLDLSL